MFLEILPAFRVKTLKIMSPNRIFLTWDVKEKSSPKIRPSRKDLFVLEMFLNSWKIYRGAHPLETNHCGKDCMTVIITFWFRADTSFLCQLLQC